MKKVSTLSDCQVKHTLDAIGGKWKLIILWHVKQNTLRFSELEKAIPDISQKMLSQSLRQLEKDQLIERRVFPTIPPKVEYSITDLGKSLDTILEAMDKWGREHQQIVTTNTSE